jgi:hypothetical protein
MIDPGRKRGRIVPAGILDWIVLIFIPGLWLFPLKKGKQGHRVG